MIAFLRLGVRMSSLANETPARVADLNPRSLMSSSSRIVASRPRNLWQSEMTDWMCFFVNE